MIQVTRTESNPQIRTPLYVLRGTRQEIREWLSGNEALLDFGPIEEYRPGSGAWYAIAYKLADRGGFARPA